MWITKTSIEEKQIVKCLSSDRVYIYVMYVCVVCYVVFARYVFQEQVFQHSGSFAPTLNKDCLS